TNIGPIQVSFRVPFTNGNLFYTLDGSSPSLNSSNYAGPFTLTNSATIRVIAYSADLSQSSQLGPIQVVIVPVYSLTITTLGEGTVAANPSPGPYPSNTVVAVTATPVANWIFLGWTGDATGPNPAITVTMDHDKSVQAEFSLVPGGIPPTITAPPANQTVNAWQDARFTVTATGSAPLSYQWSEDGVNIPGATNASLTLINVQANQAGNYAVVIMNAYGNVTSSVVVLTVNPA